jgi:DNA-binding NtrC family response regulator
MTNNTPLVLIVDDDAPIRELLSRWLTAAGYETLQAPDAETALPIMMSGVADVVLCDVTMPGRGGLWLVERAREACPSVAVVLATGMATVHPSIGLAGNVVEYLIKPFECATVLAAVERARAAPEAAPKPSDADAGEPLDRWLRGGRAAGTGGK